MIFISHRGNLEGPNPETENSPNATLNALALGYQVELDVWHKGNSFYLGHDEPKYLVTKEFLMLDNLWCHAKNIKTASILTQIPEIHSFFHQNDDISITSKNYLWTFPGKELLTCQARSIAVVPERVNYDWSGLRYCYGICSDYIKELSLKYNEIRTSKINYDI